jgi:hypothetical protein
MLLIDLWRYWSVVAIPMGDTLKSSCGTVFVFCHQSQYVMSSLTEPAMAQAPIDTKIDVDGVVALIDKLKAMLVNMVAIEEAKRATTCCIDVVSMFGCPLLPFVLLSTPTSHHL